VTRFYRLVASLAIASVLASCVNANQVAMQIGAPPKVAVEMRAMQTRRFDTLDEVKMIAAATQTMQDLGYIVSESQTDVGVLVGSKMRDAEETGQIAGQVALTIMFALLGAVYNPVWDKDQNISLTIVTTPIDNSKQHNVRASFSRHITNTSGKTASDEVLIDPKIYQEFFDKLSEGVFLEAHAI